MITLPDFASHNTQTFNMFAKTGLQTVFATAPGVNGYEMTIYDVIGTAETNSTTFTAGLEQAAGAPITIRLSSPGGSVFEGWTMANSLRNYPGDSTVIIDGVCASIATALALAANRVEMAETSLFMIHNSWLATVGNAADLRDSAAVLDKIDANLRSIYAAKSGQDSATWAIKMAAETWFLPEEAIAAGLVDAIASVPNPHRAQAAHLSGMMAQVEDTAVLRAQLRVRRALIASAIAQ